MCANETNENDFVKLNHRHRGLISIFCLFFYFLCFAKKVITVKQIITNTRDSKLKTSKHSNYSIVKSVLLIYFCRRKFPKNIYFRLAHLNSLQARLSHIDIIYLKMNYLSYLTTNNFSTWSSINTHTSLFTNYMPHHRLISS